MHKLFFLLIQVFWKLNQYCFCVCVKNYFSLIQFFFFGGGEEFRFATHFYISYKVYMTQGKDFFLFSIFFAFISYLCLSISLLDRYIDRYIHVVRSKNLNKTQNFKPGTLLFKCSFINLFYQKESSKYTLWEHQSFVFLLRESAWSLVTKQFSKTVRVTRYWLIILSALLGELPHVDCSSDSLSSTCTYE